jgi:hypothetical protein
MLIINISQLNIPEKVLFLLPIILFFPAIIRKLKLWRRKKLAYAEVKVRV